MEQSSVVSDSVLADKVMSFEEFKRYLEKELYPWLSHRDRSLSSHILGVEDWARGEYNRVHKIKGVT